MDIKLSTIDLDKNIFDRFFRFIDARENTFLTYSRALKQLWRFLDENCCAERPSRDDIIAFKEYLIRSGKSAATRQIYITAARAFFSWTAQEGIYPNITEYIKGARVDRSHKKEPLTTAQVKSLLDTIDTRSEIGRRDHSMLLLMITGGLRTIEIVRTNVRDIRNVADKTVLYLWGKGRDERSEYVIISDRTERALRDYISHRSGINSESPLFCSLSNRNLGQRLDTKSVRRMVKDRLRDIGINDDRISAHSLRHTAITLSLLGGATLDETQQFARHSNIQTTMIYDHAIDMLKNSCSSTIERMIS